MPVRCRRSCKQDIRHCFLLCYRIPVERHNRMYVYTVIFFSLVPYPNSRMYFTITDLSNNPVQYAVYHHYGSRASFSKTDVCFSKQSRIAQNLMHHSIRSLFNVKYLKIKTNCPLFAWLTYNNETYNSLVKLGFLKNEPFNPANAASYGFSVLSYVMKNHFVFRKEFMEKVAERRRAMGGGKCVGFHMRMGNTISDFRDSHQFLFNSNIPSFGNCTIVSKYENATIFLSSDSSSAIQFFKNTLTNHRVVSFHSRATHTEKIYFPKKENHALSSALLDLVTLGGCDELVGTASSTFTILASSLIGKLPYLVRRNSNCYLPAGFF